MIGNPGAYRILFVASVVNRFAVDSNGLRVLLRLGHGNDDGIHDRSYRPVIEEIERQPAMSAPAAGEVYLPLGKHGRLTCRRTTPTCSDCPMRTRCRGAAR